MPKQFEIMPRFLDYVGVNCPDMSPAMTKLAEDIAGGLISRYSFFENLFRPDTYEKKEKNKKPQEKDDVRSKMSQHGGRDFDESKDFYPAFTKSNLELQLENYAKQVVTSINEVLC